MRFCKSKEQDDTDSLIEVANISDLACEVPRRSRQGYLMSTVGFEAIVLITGGMRLFDHWRVNGVLKLDDYFMAAALVSLLLIQYSDN